MMILTAFVLGATVLFILSPLLTGADPAFDESGEAPAARADELADRKSELLGSIKDLELEYAVGKLTREDYDRIREQLAQQTIDVYRELDGNDET